MALSGSFSAGIRSNKYKLRVDWSATQSIANNTSTVTCTMYLVQASGFDLYISGRSNTTTINGEAKSWSSPAISGGDGKTSKLGTVTSSAITHNADGTKSITIKAVFNVRATISGTYYETITAEDTITLNTIPRATTPTLSASSVNMGGTITISMPRASTAFTHDLAYAFAGSGYINIATGQATSYNWTVPDLAAKIPNAASGVVTVRCITKNGATVIGTKYVTFTAKIPTGVIPTVSTVTVTPQNTGAFASSGVFIAGVSQAAVSIAASGAKGSTITAYSVTFEGRAYNTSSFTTPTITRSGTLTLTVRVKDSRGRWSSTKSVDISVASYTKPRITTVGFYRASGTSGSPSSNGTYLSFKPTYIVSSIKSSAGAELNSATITVQSKSSLSSTWLTIYTGAVSTFGSSVTFTEVFSGFSADTQYNVRVRVTDATGAYAEYDVTVPTTSVIFDVNPLGETMAFGKMSERADAFEFGKGVQFYDAVYGTVMGLGGLPYVGRDEDLNDYTDIGCWGVDSNLKAEYISNMPIQVAGRLVVESANGAPIAPDRYAYLRQKFIPYRTEYPIYERDMSRATSGGAWTFSEWVATSLSGQKVLWSGTWYMTAAQTANLSEAVSAQPNGIVLIFSRYNSSTGAAENSNFNSFFVPKQLVTLQPGAGHCFQMNSVNYSYICSKYLYINDSTITGNDLNSSTATSPNGVTYNNSSYVLRYVLGV